MAYVAFLGNVTLRGLPAIAAMGSLSPLSFIKQAEAYDIHKYTHHPKGKEIL
jgi:hypothetical protein